MLPTPPSRATLLGSAQTQPARPGSPATSPTPAAPRRRGPTGLLRSPCSARAGHRGTRRPPRSECRFRPRFLCRAHPEVAHVRVVHQEPVESLHRVVQEAPRALVADVRALGRCSQWLENHLGVGHLGMASTSPRQIASAPLRKASTFSCDIASPPAPRRRGLLLGCCTTMLRAPCRPEGARRGTASLRSAHRWLACAR
jgi:hypothetical protein